MKLNPTLMNTIMIWVGCRIWTKVENFVKSFNNSYKNIQFPHTPSSPRHHEDAKNTIYE
jgi:hypothetical protein